MILYFSATGNSKHVAKRVAAAVGDSITAIDGCAASEQYTFDLINNEPLGIISPVYDWGLPSIVRDFLGKAAFMTDKEAYVYFVATYGTTSGQAARMAAELLSHGGIKLSAKFSVKMPDTWTVLFDLSNADKVGTINANADKEIDGIIPHIASHDTGDFSKNKIPYFIAKIAYRHYESVRQTKHFHILDSCVGCGSCAKNCPVQAITLENSKPRWVKSKCAMCLRCLHRCPRFSIQYENKTQNHGQYVHP